MISQTFSAALFLKMPTVCLIGRILLKICLISLGCVAENARKYDSGWQLNRFDSVAKN